jgi:hypothetical protein
MDEEMEPFSEVENKNNNTEVQKDSIYGDCDKNNNKDNNNNNNNNVYSENFAIFREKDLLDTPSAIVVKGDNLDEYTEIRSVHQIPINTEVLKVEKEGREESETEEEETVEKKEILNDANMVKEESGKRKKKKKKGKKKKEDNNNNNNNNNKGLSKMNEESLISTVNRYEF